MNDIRTPAMARFASPTNRSPAASRIARAVLILVIVELTIATAYIHLSLGGTLFTLNALGYAGLAAAYAMTAAVPLALVQRLAWLVRIGLAGYTLLTIGAYLVAGSYFPLGWGAKGIELAIVGLVAVDMITAGRRG